MTGLLVSHGAIVQKDCQARSTSASTYSYICMKYETIPVALSYANIYRVLHMSDLVGKRTSQVEIMLSHFGSSIIFK